MKKKRQDKRESFSKRYGWSSRNRKTRIRKKVNKNTLYESGVRGDYFRANCRTLLSPVIEQIKNSPRYTLTWRGETPPQLDISKEEEQNTEDFLNKLKQIAIDKVTIPSHLLKEEK